MVNPEHIAMLKEGPGAWNKWRAEHPEALPDLREADLSRTDLHDAHFAGAELANSCLQDADLC